MKRFAWDPEKNEKLKAERGIGFEEIQKAVESGSSVRIIKHPNQDRYSNQKIFVVSINNYVYLSPFVEDEEEYFLKTLFPSSKATKKYLKEAK